MELEIFPGEFELFGETDVFADHRLKSYWRLETYNTPLDSDHLDQTFYSQIDIEALDDARLLSLSGSMALLLTAGHSYSGTATTDSWAGPR